MIVRGTLRFGRFRERLNRFAVSLDDLSGRRRRCHLRDPGRLSELLLPGAGILFLERRSPGRSTDCEVLAVWDGVLWTVVNSGLHSGLAEELISSGRARPIPAAPLRREVRFRDSRLDFLVSSDPPWLVEVKGCTLVRDGLALFPDAPTERGTRHVSALEAALGEGYRAAVLFLVMRPDARALVPNREADPRFAEALISAADAGVETLAHTFRLSGRVVEPVEPIPVLLG